MSDFSEILTGGFVAVSKDLIAGIGTLPAVFVSELISEFEYWEERDELDKDGFFFSTLENVERQTCISKKQQFRLVYELEQTGLIEKKLKGSPPKRYFKINIEKLKEIVANVRKENKTLNVTFEYQKGIIESAEREHLKVPKGNNQKCQKGIIKSAERELSKVPKGNTNNNNIIKINNNNNNNNNIYTHESLTDTEIEKQTPTETKKTKPKKKNNDEIKELIQNFVANEITEDKETTEELLFEWLEVRKAQRAANTNRAITENLSDLKKFATKSGLSVNEYLREVVKRSWRAFYEIGRNNYYGTSNKVPDKQEREIKFKPNCGVHYF